ncbi:hypothetical protein TNCV_3213951 [Trichonephila clavipes]|nr:hypothetical protein TNCV_3213951 [Trichonephila clavipes]
MVDLEKASLEGRGPPWVVVPLRKKTTTWDFRNEILRIPDHMEGKVFSGRFRRTRMTGKISRKKRWREVTSLEEK